MTDERALSALVGDLEQSLALLDDYRQADNGNLPAEQLPSLLEQCLSLTADYQGPAPVRSIHHFACSGGTLMTKCLTALPNVVTLSEIDPLSRQMLNPAGHAVRFAPTDLIWWLRNATREVDEDMLVDVFCAGLRVAHEKLSQNGHHLLLRDHAHSQFCRNLDPDSRPTLHEMLTAAFPVLSLVSVRHPLDSFLSLRSNGWVHFHPDTLEEYSQRYLMFLDRHAGLPVVKYEDFVTDPEAILTQMSELLRLPFNPMALDLLSVVRLSGDSGRASSRIALRPRRELPADLEAARGQSPAYTDLCDRLSYEP